MNDLEQAFTNHITKTTNCNVMEYNVIKILFFFL